MKKLLILTLAALSIMPLQSMQRSSNKPSSRSHKRSNNSQPQPASPSQVVRAMCQKCGQYQDVHLTKEFTGFDAAFFSFICKYCSHKNTVHQSR